MAFARVIVKLFQRGEDRIYTYRVPEDMELRVGMMVRVPFGSGNRTLDGFVIGLSAQSDYPEDKIKPISRVLGRTPVFGEAELDMAAWMQRRYYAPLSACLALFVPRDPDRLTRMVTWVQMTASPRDGERLGSVQKQIVDALRMQSPMRLADLQERLKTARASLHSLEAKGLIRCYDEPEEVPAPVVLRQIDPEARKSLNGEQQEAVRAIMEASEEGVNRTFLLYGITGSGKTEVYMECMERVLAAGKGAIMLVPEISLTPQLLDRLGRRFGNLVAVLHSRLNDTERSREWERIRLGAARVVVGPRSALFAPMKDPGIIILDEEHETSYKSDLQPRYHAAEVAAEMAARGAFPLVLGSATPSTESYYHAMEGSYRLLRLSRRAVQEAELPRVRLVDMRRELAMGNMSLFSMELMQAVRRRLERREQTILFLNRRGYSSFVSCRKCGFVLRCPACFLPYTYHKDQNRLICHHCGRSTPAVTECPGCGSRFLKQFGIGTERVMEGVQELFPNARVMRMDASTTTGKNSFQEMYEQIRDFGTDIIVGTQMIAKGMDMPRVTLVGVMAADMTLYYPDFHSTERTYQLLTQVAGRAGRGDLPGEVIIQTYDPGHYVLQSVAAHRDEEFYEQELASRKMLQCPPFTHLAQILLTGRSEDKVREAAGLLKRIMTDAGRPEMTVLGPSPAELGRIDNVFRWKIMVRAVREEALVDYTRRCLEQFERQNREIGVALDLNPVHMY